MKTSIATVSISGRLADKIEAIAGAGFDGLEIFENDFLTFDGTARDVARMVRDHGLELTLFQPFRDFETLTGAHRARAFDRAERKFDLMSELETDMMLICSTVSPHAVGGIDRAAADFYELGERAAKHGIKVGYEALCWGRYVNDHRDAWEVVRRADHPNIGLILDSFHTLAREIDPESIRSIPKDKIFIVQLADAPLIHMDLLHWSRHLRNMPGEGDLPVKAFMRAVAATGYDGYLSLEIFNDQFRGGSAKIVAADGHRSLLQLMDQVRREEPEIAMPVPHMPEPIRVHGVEFIEFATDDAQAAQLTQQLRAMGFHEAGRHRSKRVTLFRQGDINIVVNTERQGFAHSAFIVRGTSAYAIGLHVGDADAALARAHALGATPFKQPPNPGEITLPAVRGVGGGVIYFVDRKGDLANLWEREFVATPPPPGLQSGLVHIDHIAQTMFAEELPTALLFYTSIFSLRKLPVVDIVDPGGLVRSQVVENEGGTLRITLNGAENRHTLAGHFLAETFGSGVQHLAFATDDIFATAAAFAASGFSPLAIAPNYYDDLEARFGLPSELTAELRASNILYDSDANGEFFQFYGQSGADGFFFEIVQRTGYRGYGGPNAPFRIAAQTRTLPPLPVSALG